MVDFFLFSKKINHRERGDFNHGDDRVLTTEDTEVLTTEDTEKKYSVRVGNLG